MGVHTQFLIWEEFLNVKGVSAPTQFEQGYINPNRAVIRIQGLAWNDVVEVLEHDWLRAWLLLLQKGYSCQWQMWMFLDCGLGCCGSDVRVLAVRREPQPHRAVGAPPPLRPAGTDWRRKLHSCSAGGCSQLSVLPVVGTSAAHCYHRYVKQMMSAHCILHSMFSNECSILFYWSKVHPWLCGRLSGPQSHRCFFAKWINSLSAKLGGKDIVNQTSYHHSLLYSE